jgi:hypothetical protein
LVATISLRVHHWRSISIQGAVIRRDDDTRKEMPVSDAQVTLSDGVTSATTQSDASGGFRLTFRGGVWPGQVVHLTFRHPDYQPLDLKVQTSLGSGVSQLYVAALTPIPLKPEKSPDSQQSVVSNIVVRYTVNSQAEQDIGSVVKTFQVVNKGNVLCNNQPPCSPDGRWKASSESVSLDAGPGNEFRNLRASCIAGPCPFTRFDSRSPVRSDRTIKVSALNWSDTATFLVEAEVFHASIISNVRLSYPVVFGHALNFTLPPTQEGVSIEADVDGTPMVFPLGPELYLSWANCTVRKNTEAGEQSTVYQCELKPGYRF